MRRIILLFSFLCLSVIISAQEKTISGVVKDGATGELLPGVNVTIKGTTIGAITGLDGTYTIKANSNDAVLVFSFVGFIDEEIRVGDQTAIDVNLEADILGLDEVVVVGYGTQKKSLVTGSIAKMESEDIMSTAPTRAEQALQGKTAGVTIMQNSGAPGSALTVRVRGVGSNFNSEPLYVVDGMRVSSIDFINPSDISEIEVLKDAASAAIYGAEGANGVVLISTKKGSSKSQSHVNYDFYYGIQTVPEPLELMDAKEYSIYKREAIEAGIRWDMREYDRSVQDIFVNSALEKSLYPHPDSITTNTNWIDEITEPAPVISHNLSFNGGSEKSQYSVSLGYFTQDGVIGGEQSNFKRYSARLNTNHKLKDWLSAGTKFVYSYDTRKPQNENNEYGGLVMNSILLDPLTPTHFQDINDMPYYDAALERFGGDKVALENSGAMQDSKGYYGQSQLVINEIVNPIAQINNTHTEIIRNRVLGGVFFDVTPLKDFRYHAQFDFDYFNQDLMDWYPVVYYQPQAGGGTISSVINQRNNNISWQLENYMTYSKEFGKHTVTALLGSTVREEHSEYLIGSGSGMQEESDNFAHLDATTIDSLATSGGRRYPIQKMMSYFGRLSYNYGEKYMLEFVLRRDGSSLFPENNQYAYFPSMSAGWVISREDFWSIEFINMLKVRASWGQNGSQSNLTPFMYVSSISTQSTPSPLAGNGVNPLFNLNGNGQPMSVAQPVAIANPDLKWETSEQTDIGIDFGFFNNRITFSADYYVKKTKDLLTRGGASAYVGNASPWINAGSIKNQGVEFEISYKEKFGEVGFNVSANAAYLKNEVTEILQDGYILPGASANGMTITQFEKGYPAWYFVGYKTDGVFQNEEELNSYPHLPNHIVGDLKYLDLNDDGEINDDDREYIGSPWPDWTFGLNIGADYKGFDLSIFVNGSLGNEILNGFHRTDVPNHNLQKKIFDDRWRPQSNENGSVASSNSGFKPTNNGANMQFSDFWIEDGSWVKLRTVTLGYTLPKFNSGINPFEKFRVYVQGQNLLTLTKYSGMDPEIGNTSGSTIDNSSNQSFNSVGVDRGFYPSPRTFIVGLNLTF